VNQRINPVVAVVIAVVVLLGIGFASYKLFGHSDGGASQQMVSKPPPLDDPHYKMDPKLGLQGTGGG